MVLWSWVAHWLLIDWSLRARREGIWLDEVGNCNNILIIHAPVTRLAPTNQRVINDLSLFCWIVQQPPFPADLICVMGLLYWVNVHFMLLL